MTEEKQQLKKKLELFSFPLETIEFASTLGNLQKALDWIFASGDMGELAPGKAPPPVPKVSSKPAVQSSSSSSPSSSTSSSSSSSSSEISSKQSTMAQRIIQLENEGYSQDEIKTILAEEKLLKFQSASTPSSSASSQPSVVPPSGVPVLDLATATDEDLAKLLQSQVDAEDAAVIAENITGGSEDVAMTAEKRILNQKEKAQKAREYQERIRKEIAEREKKAELEKERARREQGKNMVGQKDKYDQMILKAQREERIREKNWEKNEMARIRKKIAEDKERRKKEQEAASKKK